MSTNSEKIKKILKLIESGKLSPKQGQELIKKVNEVKKDIDFSTPFKAVILNKPIKLEELEAVPIEEKEPGYNGVQVMVKAFSLNFSDMLSVQGMYPNMPPYPFTPGCECAGVVRKVGKGVTHLKIGDEVIVSNDITLGAHSSLMVTDKELVYKKPKNIPFEIICGMSLVFFTSYHSLKVAKVKKGDKILIQGAAGGVGHVAVQIAQYLGAEVYGTYGGDTKKANYLKSIGVKHCIDYRNYDFKEEILKQTNGYGVDVVINTLSGQEIQKGLDLLAPNGRYVEIAMVGLRSTKLFDLSHLVDNQSFYSIDLSRLLKKHSKLREEYIEKMIELLQKNIVRPTVGKVFTLSHVKDAYQYMKQRKNIGKIVVDTELSDIFIKQEVEKQIQEYEYSDDKNSENYNVPIRKSDIAIIGMSGQYAGAKNIEMLWENLISGKDCIVDVPEDRWDKEAYYDPDKNKLDKINCKCGGFLTDIDKFEPMFFNMSGHEAIYAEPQQRLFLKEAWSALEYAGYAVPEIGEKKVGVFMGCGPGDYQDKMIENNILFDPQSFWGTSPAAAAARISYLLNLKGPSIAIDTACSSSLVAINLACQSIRLGECDMAIAGGTFLTTTPKFYLMSSNAKMLSSTGKCHTFDKDADGFVPGEGAGVVILKPLEQAIKDRDHICGILKGYGSNQDGRTNGLTAPSTRSQTQLERDVYNKFNINPETITYLEAHGTGTQLGDSIEIEALTNAFSKYTNKKQFCAIGSIKTNIGHTSVAGGVAGIIKVLLAFENNELPPSLNYKHKNPYIDFENSPFYVSDKVQKWQSNDKYPRRAAVSSFGFSGTNAHMVIEEPPRGIQRSFAKREDYIFPFSAKTKESLKRKLEDMYVWIDKNSSKYTLEDISYTLQIKRSHFKHREVFVVKNIDDLKSKLKLAIENKMYEIEGTNLNSKLAKDYLKGEKINWTSFHKDEECVTVPLPTYPFNEARYWLKSDVDNGKIEEKKAIGLLEQLQNGQIGLEEVEILIEGGAKGEE